MRRLALLPLVWLALVAATPLPPKPPPPDLRALVPWAAASLDKLPLEVPRLALPGVPLVMPPVAPAAVVLPAANKPMAPLPSTRALPCVGTWLRIASESLECGRARLVRGEWEEAANALDYAVRGSSDRVVLVEARYWRGEALYRLGRVEQADWLFRQALADLALPEIGPWALNGSGWTALRLGDAPRAEDAFRRLLRAPQPVPLDSWGRHGLALALYARGRYDEAEKVWAELAARRVPTTLARDALFYRGDALARIGQVDRGIESLEAFTRAGAHPLMSAALLRLGWWRLAARRVADALAAFRALAAAPPATTAPDREWLDAGLALATVQSGDWAGARAALRPLDGRRSALAQPIRLSLMASAVEGGRVTEALTVAQELLSANLIPPVRAWVLLVKGEALRVDGNRDEARTQFGLARGSGLGTEVGRQAVVRLAEMNFQLREFAQAAADLVPLLNTAATPETRLSALLLRGEASYHAGDYAAAAEAYRRVLAEFPAYQRAAPVHLALAWTALRQGARAEALRQFLAFAQAAPDDPHAVDALVLASELELAGGQLETARQLLDRVIAGHGTHPRAELARFNRALLHLRAGEAQAAQTELASWIARAPSSPLVGRARVALGASLLALGHPADAERQFAGAQAEGMAALGALGLGAADIVQERWEDAARALTQARDSGTPPVVAAADYGLAVVAFHKGKVAEFKKVARATLDAAPRAPGAPALLYVLTALAVDDKNWPESLTDAKQLVGRYPDDPTADDALERVGSAAAGAGAWPVAYEAYALLRERYPRSPFVASSAVAYAKALLATSRPTEARKVLEAVAGRRGDAGSGQAWLLLARARKAVGDNAGALDAYSQAAKAGDSVKWPTATRFDYARGLMEARRFDEARGVLQHVLRAATGPVAGEAALALGEAYAGQGDRRAAVEYFMTAAYVAPDSLAGRRALIAAGRAFAAAKDADAASIVYRKLLAQPNAPADLVDEARKALARLKR